VAEAPKDAAPIGFGFSLKELHRHGGTQEKNIAVAAQYAPVS
jgi:hypothetical protein